jgi:dihydroxyacetone kinase-like protein
MEKVLQVDATTVRDWIGRVATELEVNKDLLTQLDSAIGDADHGINMVRGFTAVTAALADAASKDAAPASPGEVLVLVGSTLISKVGGASGPLYGTAFRRAGKALGAAPDISADALGTALAAALEGVQGLGAAAEGDKTMVDALAPAVRAYHQAQAAGASIADAASAAARAAAVGAEATIPLQALKGRASYLGPRSVGHQDPGATSTSLVLAALAASLAGSD